MKKKTKYESYPTDQTVDMFEWIIEQDKDPLDVWETIDHQAIPIVNLRPAHLQKILEYMNARPGWRHEQKIRIEAELKRREKAKLIRKSKAGKLFYGTDV